MSDDEIKIMLEGAFRPLSCIAQLDDYGEKLKLRVTDREKRVFPFFLPIRFVAR